MRPSEHFRPPCQTQTHAIAAAFVTLFALLHSTGGARAAERTAAVFPFTNADTNKPSSSTEASGGAFLADSVIDPDRRGKATAAARAFDKIVEAWADGECDQCLFAVAIANAHTTNVLHFYTPEFPSGSPVTISAEFSVEGTLSGNPTGAFPIWAYESVLQASVSAPGTFVIVEGIVDSDPATSDELFSNGTYEITFTVPNDGSVLLTLSARATAAARSWTASGLPLPASANVDFFSSLKWQGVTLVLAPDGTPVTNYTLVDEFGTDWTTAATGPLPPPPCFTEGRDCDTDAHCDDKQFCNGIEVCNLPATADCHSPDGTQVWIKPIPQSQCLAMGWVWEGVGTCACGSPLCLESEFCDEQTNVCRVCDNEGATCTNNLPCDDGNPCNGEEICSFPATATCASPDGSQVWFEPIPQSQCVAMGWFWHGVGACACGTKLACDDGIECTEDTCGPGGCEFAPIECDDDGLACTAEACTRPCDDCAVECEHPLLPDFCLIGGECYAAGDRHPPQGCLSCDPGTDQHNWTLLPVGSSCDDTLAACLINGVCDEFGACSLEPHHELCDDGIFCTTDLCTPIGCISTPQDIVCDDGIDCTESLCVPGVGCKHTPIHAVCGDGLFCNGAERCVVGVGCRPAPYMPCGSRPCDERYRRCLGRPDPTRPQAGTRSNAGS